MNTTITGKQFELTEPIKNYIQRSFESLEKYNLNIISARCVISADEKHGKKGFIVDLSINLAGKNTIVITHKDKDLYAAIDDISSRASKVLRREHDKNTTHKNKDEAKEVILDQELNIESQVDEIVPMELDTYKPLEIDEALKILKESKDQFLVFNDVNAKMRVIYKKKDSKFGLF
ncbi:ribosome-associated translation inhibitor RaiA [Campylobacter sp. FMV-PI01]|uniref:Ribosome hibernation promoting factor n=1 Tax=Campylobacter portucalensis TaxID=2608384 RepID=A0A6L5WLA3_9BACT|nr:ribosome-associated translation inhibitor RaiA [Campylobacter portucalensis]MSN97162.1 ribosome-associated translation inhibitor RaiA [Campylobacter portucalensis]